MATTYLPRPSVGFKKRFYGFGKPFQIRNAEFGMRIEKLPVPERGTNRSRNLAWVEGSFIPHSEFRIPNLFTVL
jgi:hypothetical protein